MSMKLNDFFKLKVKKDPNVVITSDEVERLRAIPRYHKTSTTVFGVPVEVNDTCTLIGDVNEIIIKNIYQFKASNESPIIIDCGSNIGMSVIYFKRLYPNSKVFAFEPDPTLFAMLSTNISNFSFDSVELNQAAVWINEDGIDFRTEGGHSGRISDNKDDKGIVVVPSIRLKNLLVSFDTIDMLKMDIEGAEADVLFDCGKLLDKCEHVFIEYHSRHDKKQELHDILKLFSDMGFRYHVHEAFVRKHPFIDTNCMIDMDLQLNLFFKKQK